MADDTKPEETKAEAKAPDLEKIVKEAIAKHGDNTAALRVFAADLASLKQDNATLREQLPPKSALVLTGDDVKAWDEYKAIGKPADLRKVAKDHDEAVSKLAVHDRDAELRGVADKAGLKFPVLRTLAADLTFGEGKAKGKDGKDATFVTVKAGDAEPVPIDEYANEHWGDFLPSLRPATTAPQAGRPNATPNRSEATHRRNEPPANGQPRAIDAKDRHMMGITF